MSPDHTATATALRHRYDALGIPEFAQALATPGVMQGATWWKVTSSRPAANDELGTSSEYFAREAVRLRASVFKLRLSQVIHDGADDFMHST